MRERSACFPPGCFESSSRPPLLVSFWCSCGKLRWPIDSWLRTDDYFFAGGPGWMTYSPNRDDLGELLEICDPGPRLSAEIESPQVCWRLTALPHELPHVSITQSDCLIRPMNADSSVRLKRQPASRRARVAAPRPTRSPTAGLVVRR